MKHNPRWEVTLDAKAKEMIRDAAQLEGRSLSGFLRHHALVAARLILARRGGGGSC